MARAKGKAATTAALRLLTERAGLRLSPEELEKLRPAFLILQEQMRRLHALDLAGEEPALTLKPEDVQP